MLDLQMLRADFDRGESPLQEKIHRITYEIGSFLLSPSVETAAVVEAWKEEFSYIYGEPNSHASGSSGWEEQELLQIFALQTCFSILVKIMMRGILCDYFAAERDAEAGREVRAGHRSEAGQGVRTGQGAKTGRGVWAGHRAEADCGAEADDRRTGYRELLLGEFAKSYGIENYCEEDWYCWPIYEADRGFGEIIDELEHLLEPYRTELSPEDFMRGSNVDYIKQIYEAMIPKELRHALGEYYTPDWLAKRTLQDALKYMDKPVDGLRMIDPTCGSGTFLIQGIAAKRRAGCSLDEILSAVCGFDINALAVLTAKTNYLLSVLDMLGTTERLFLPVYKADILQLAEGSVCINDLCGQADLIIGNPPWVNWEYLPEKYRLQSQHLWADYGLFSARGRNLSFSKEDISVLITYIAMDKLLREGGVIGFVIRQGVFKSAQNGAGFRRFRIREECGIQVLQVDDLSGVRAFDNAVTSTALFFARKGAETSYPVPYYIWRKNPADRRASFGAYSDLEEVLGQIQITKQCAMPAVAEDRTSLWMSAPEEQIDLVRRVLGSNSYRARTGVFTGGANGVYRLRIHGTEGGQGLVRVSNVVERAKRRVEQVDTKLERDYLFPMIKGSNVRRWNVGYDTYLLCPHTAQTKQWPVPGEVLRETCPETYRYLEGFREELDGRKGFAGWEKEIQRQHFHAVLRVGDYTFCKYKVLWKYIATEFVCAVIGEVRDPYLGRKVCLPNEKLMYVGTDNETEAYYLCGILSSSVVADCVKSYMNPTSISAHVLDKLNIPTFDPQDERHLQIAELCRRGHGKTRLRPYLDKIDEIVNSIYG